MVPWNTLRPLVLLLEFFFKFWEDTGQKTKVLERPSLKFRAAAADDDVDDGDGDGDDDEGDYVLLPP